MELHVITNGKLSKQQLEDIPRLMKAVDFLHIREHQRTARELYDMVHLLLDKGVPANQLIINDRVDLALLMEAYGVQLGYRSYPIKAVNQLGNKLHVGKSIHSLREALKAENEGADYLVFGHIFSTRSKEGLPPRGISPLQEIVEAVNIPVIAIGGITPNNVTEVMAAGVKGIAIMSPIWESNNPLKVIEQYQMKWQHWKEAKGEAKL